MELQNQESTDLPIYEKQLKETEVGITNMLNAIQMGILTSSTKERLEALEEQRKELQARIAEERLAKPKMKEEFVRFWLLRFRKLDMTQPEQRQALVDTFINGNNLFPFMVKDFLYITNRNSIDELNDVVESGNDQQQHHRS